VHSVRGGHLLHRHRGHLHCDVSKLSSGLLHQQYGRLVSLHCLCSRQIRRLSGDSDVFRLRCGILRWDDGIVRLHRVCSGVLHFAYGHRIN